MVLSWKFRTFKLDCIDPRIVLTFVFRRKWDVVVEAECLLFLLHALWFGQPCRSAQYRSQFLYRWVSTKFLPLTKCCDDIRVENYLNFDQHFDEILPTEFRVLEYTYCMCSRFAKVRNQSKWQMLSKWAVSQQNKSFASAIKKGRNHTTISFSSIDFTCYSIETKI